MSDTSSRRLGALPSLVLDQLGPSSWLPAMTLVGGLTVTAELRRIGEPDVPAAMAQISRYSLGGFAVLAGAVVVVAMLTQAFAFGAIGVMVGRWGTDRVSNWLAGCGIAVETRRRHRLLAAIRSTERAGRAQAVATLEDRRTPDAEEVRIDIVELFGDDWGPFAEPSTLRRLERLRALERCFPAAHRILPTRLGNVVRSYADPIDTGGGSDLDDLDAYVLRHRDDLPTSLVARHDGLRVRLDLYCTLEATFVMLAVVVTAALVPLGRDMASAGLTLAAFHLAFAVLCSRAAMASAHAHGRALTEIGAQLRARVDLTAPPEGGEPPEPDDQMAVLPPPSTPGLGHDPSAPDVVADGTIVVPESRPSVRDRISSPRSMPGGSSRTRR